MTHGRRPAPARPAASRRPAHEICERDGRPGRSWRLPCWG